MTIKLSEDNLNEIMDLTKKNPVFGYEIVETLAKDLLRLTGLCKDIVKARDKYGDDWKRMDMYISRIKHAVRNSEENANL
jgi:hypothetical protein